MRFRLALALLLASAFVTLTGNRAVAQQKPAALPFTIDWDTPLGASPAARPAYDATHAFLALQATDKTPAQLVAVSLADGKVAWHRPLGAPDAAAALGTPSGAPGGVRSLAADDNLIFAATSEAIAAFSAADGEPAWQIPMDATSAPLAAAGGWLVIPAEKRLVAVRGRQGTLVWQLPLDSPPIAAPVFAGDAVYVPLADARVLRVALTTGAIVWQVKLPAAASTILALDDHVFVGLRGRFFYALDPRNGHKQWRVRIGSDVVGTPAVDKKLVYFISLDNLIRGVDRGNGSLQARHVLTRRALFGPLVAGDLLLVSGITDTIEGFRIGTLAPAGTYDAGERGQRQEAGQGQGLGGMLFVGPIHVAPGGDEGQVLVVGVTGEGEVIALKKPEK